MNQRFHCSGAENSRRTDWRADPLAHRFRTPRVSGAKSLPQVFKVPRSRRRVYQLVHCRAAENTEVARGPFLCFSTFSLRFPHALRVFAVKPQPDVFNFVPCGTERPMYD
jgi:hypothetical protein